MNYQILQGFECNQPGLAYTLIIMQLAARIDGLVKSVGKLAA